MIDTIFFLLVFFMISTLSMSRYSGLPVNLPKAATGQQPASESAAVTITPDGKVFIDKQEVARENIRTVLQQRLSANPDLLILINADERVEHGRVVDVMDDARQAGVAKMAIAVKPKDTPAVRDDSLSLSLLASCFIHGVVIILASIIIKQSAHLRPQDFLPISLVDVPPKEQPKPIQKVETPPEIKKPPPPPPKVEKTKEPKPLAKSEIVQPKPHRRQLFPKKSRSSPSKRNPQ